MAQWRGTEVCATMAYRLPSEIVGAAILIHPRKDRSQRMTKSSITFRTSITLLLCCIPVALAAAAAPAKAQPYPSAPLKLISDSAPGSAPDAILRIVADRLGQTWHQQGWGQQIVVMNQPGAGGSVAARAAAGATPDGHTLFMAVSSAFVTIKGAAPNIPIAVPRDFAPVSLIGEQPMFITIAPQTGIKTLPALIEAAKQKPGEISYAVSGRGRQSHLTGEMLQRRTGIKLLMVPYSGGPAQAMSDLMGGRVQMLIEGGTALIGAMQSGKLTALAVGSETRLAEFPDLPAAAETIPNFRSAGWLAMMASAETPAALVRKVSADLKTVLDNPDVRSKLAALGSYARPMSPQDTTSFIQAEQRTWGPLLEELAGNQ
jgi:tripartite-type tricarboxylate transporter receptor subunit TctC